MILVVFIKKAAKEQQEKVLNYTKAYETVKQDLDALTENIEMMDNQSKNAQYEQRELISSVEAQSSMVQSGIGSTKRLFDIQIQGAKIALGKDEEYFQKTLDNQVEGYKKKIENLLQFHEKTELKLTKKEEECEELKNKIQGFQSKDAGRVEEKVKNTLEKLFEKLCDKAGVDFDQYTEELQEEVTLQQLCDKFKKIISKKDFK